MKAIIVGGVAVGASCAARLRRLDENVEIVMVKRAPFVSHANCGLPSFFLQEGPMEPQPVH
jgi:NADPH-dependent 2,4-dienoyl-CoA reductase/sulfur reductase-like enzyme